MVPEKLGVVVFEPIQQPGRPLDICEEEGDRAGWERVLAAGHTTARIHPASWS